MVDSFPNPPCGPVDSSEGSVFDLLLIAVKKDWSTMVNYKEDDMRFPHFAMARYVLLVERGFLSGDE